MMHPARWALGGAALVGAAVSGFVRPATSFAGRTSGPGAPPTPLPDHLPRVLRDHLDVDDDGLVATWAPSSCGGGVGCGWRRGCGSRCGCVPASGGKQHRPTACHSWPSRSSSWLPATSRPGPSDRRFWVGEGLRRPGRSPLAAADQLRDDGVRAIHAVARCWVCTIGLPVRGHDVSGRLMVAIREVPTGVEPHVRHRAWQRGWPAAPDPPARLRPAHPAGPTQREGRSTPRTRHRGTPIGEVPGHRIAARQRCRGYLLWLVREPLYDRSDGVLLATAQLRALLILAAGSSEGVEGRPEATRPGFQAVVRRVGR